MASSVANSCRVWNTQVQDPAGVVGAHGDLQHLRGLLGPGKILEAGQLVWMTDLTPHEALPLRAGTARSFFRLVTGKLSAWYADHSTPNPLGLKPPPDVEIIRGNKWSVAASVSAPKVCF
jgi:hypothetical protein